MTPVHGEVAQLETPRGWTISAHDEGANRIGLVLFDEGGEDCRAYLMTRDAARVLLASLRAAVGDEL